MYVSGSAKKDICNHLNNKGYRTKKGLKFRYNSFDNTLTNKLYIGIYNWNGTTVDNNIPAIIDEDIFNRASTIAKSKKRKGGFGSAKINYQLSGKAYCGYCKKSLNCIFANGRNKRYYYYTCSSNANKKLK